MEFENIGVNCISVISEYIPDYISFALVSRQFRDSWVGEKKTSRNLLEGYVNNGNLEMIKYYIKNGCPRPWKEYICIFAADNGHLLPESETTITPPSLGESQFTNKAGPANVMFPLKNSVYSLSLIHI